MRWVGIVLIGLGVLWESMLAPSVVGWGLVLAGFLILCLADRRWPRRTPLDWPLLLLAIMGGVSLLVTALPGKTWGQVMRLGAGLAIFYGLVNWGQGRTQFFLIAVGLVLTGMVLAVLAPVVVDWSRTKVMLIPSRIYDLFPLLVSDAVHPNIMAALMVLLLPSPLACFFSSGAKWKGGGKRIFVVIASLSMGAILLLTKSRGGYIAGAVGVLMVLWLSGRRWLASISTLIMIGGVVSFFFITSGQAPELVEGATDPGTWAFRQRVWRAALLIMADFSFTGAGMGTFNDVAALLYAFHETQNPGAHNLYLQVGVDLGVPGLIAFLSMIGTVFWMAISSVRALSQEDELHAVAVGTLAGIVALVIHGLVDVTVWGTRVAFAPWLVIGLVVALYRWQAADGRAS